MDKYLANIGLYRKMIAPEPSCLFRAVSEQLYYSQNYHQRIRKECVNFIKTNRCRFEPFVQGSFEKYLERLEDPQETFNWKGQLEIKALSLLYRRCFVIYRYPGKVTTKIAEEDNLPEILLCCSNNSHYDIVYPKSYQVGAAICQALLYELLYARVLGVEEEDLQMALQGYKQAHKRYRYRKSQSKCSEDAGYYTPVDRLQREKWESSGHSRSEDKTKAQAEDQATEGSGKLALPYKVLKALEPTMYRNVEFDLWLDSRRELSSSNLIVSQKTDYMVFAGRQYFLGDRCQVCLDPKGKYYNAFIQEVGTQTTGVTVFIEELGEIHVVPLSNLMPVNPVPAWNITPRKKGNSYNRPEQYPREIDPVLPGRQWYFKKPRDKEMLMARSFSRPQPDLPPRLKPRPGSIQHVHSRGVHGLALPPVGLAHEHYRPHHPFIPPHGYTPPRSSTQIQTKHHLIGPDLAYYPSPSQRCYESFDNFLYWSWRNQQQMHSLNKERLSCVTDPGEETQDIEGSITYETEETDESAFSPKPGQAVSSLMVPGATAYWVPSVPSPIPPSGKQLMTSSEEDPDERSDAGNQEAGYQSPSVYAAAAESTTNPLVVNSSGLSSSKPVTSAPAPVFTSNSSSSSTGSSETPPDPLQPNNSPVLTPGPPLPQNVLSRPVPWFVSELGEPVATAPPPLYSYDHNGSDLPRDCKVLQYYYNLGVRWFRLSYWDTVVQMQQVYPQQVAEAPFQPYLSTVPTADRTVPQAYDDTVHMCPHPQGDMASNGTPLAKKSPPAVVSGTVSYPLVQEQCGQQLFHPPYIPYMPVLSTPYHNLGLWTPGAGPHPSIHNGTYSPLSYQPPVNYNITPTHPTNPPH